MPRKRDRIKRLTRKQIEDLLERGRRTWMRVNEVLKHGKWRDAE